MIKQMVQNENLNFFFLAQELKSSQEILRILDPMLLKAQLHRLKPLTSPKSK
jgi:hypothetical protein